MTSQSACARLIERYVAASGLRFVRGEHECEYFGATGTRRGRLHVHLEMSPSFDDVFTIQVTPAGFFSVADGVWLTNFADTWNHQNRGVTALVHVWSDPPRIGISARRSRWVPDGLSFDEFASFADGSIADAIEFFAELAPVTESPSVTRRLLRDAR
ncbi:hypothetical protein [Mycobacterium parmense]|uniref:Uncharacterized protein n=1 Tax=Mycobacterium parmense TaxID=185642 RepID=A0A7I7YS26_9MYCO|nr:hypothetical protein [Mycobacterium parmense]MCV7352016.1 hypothetical protein [Mycobacterium parmense]ORW56597.1 hypothetical protein AWC20_01780 [Mycobacterium parmense]BBZ44509.1 hypothetical protein MPRM_17900 [Mycobacterium parmense]